MNTISRVKLLFVGASIISLSIMASAQACAYVDPGTGSYVLQVVAAGVLGVVFWIGSTWGSIKRRIGKLTGRQSNDAD